MPAPALNQQRLVSYPEAAVHAGVSVTTLRRWIAAGKLPASLVGRGVRIDLDDLDRLLAPRAR